MERRFRRTRFRRTGSPLAGRRSTPDRRLLPHRPRRHPQVETMRAPRALGLLTGLAAGFANLAAAAPHQAPEAAGGVAGTGGIAAPNRCPAPSTALVVQGSILCVSIDDPANALRQRLLRDWIERSARIVADYYARFPAPLVVLHIRAATGGGVSGGRTTNESGLVIQGSVGGDATSRELAADWG